MNAGTSLTRRRMAGLVIALATALSLPVVSQAHHTECTKTGSSDPNAQPVGACPEFTPGFDMHVHYPYRNTPAQINVEVSQASHEAAMLLWESYLPKEWQYTTSLRPASRASNATIPAANCNEIFNASNNAPNAEAVSDGNAIWTSVNGTITKWTSKRGMYFLDTVGSRTTLCARFVNGSNVWTTPVYLDRIDLGDDNPYGWKLTVQTETFWQQPFVANGTPSNYADDMSLVALDIELDQRTAGTWSYNGNNTPGPVVFSRAPRNPVQTKVGTRAVACSNGGPAAGTRSTIASCTGYLMAFPYDDPDTEGPELHEFPFVVNLPPAYPPQPWAKFTRAGEDKLGTASGSYPERPMDGFGFSDGTTTLDVEWPALTAGLAPGVTVAGYALGVHKLDKHMSPSTDAEIKAGRVLYLRDIRNAPTFAKAIDLMALPENQQLGSVDGKYQVSLVTIYNTPYGNGYRSDGLCDGILSGADPTDKGRGVLCPVDRPIWVANGAGRDQGTGDFEVIVRQDAWPARYVHFQNAGGSGNGSTGSTPFQLLLLDFDKHVAELTIWGAVSYGERAVPEVLPDSGLPTNPSGFPGDEFDGLLGFMVNGRSDQGAATVFRAATEQMQAPTGPVPGFVRFGNLDLESEGYTWGLTVRLEGTLPGHSIISSAAYGVMTQYNARGGDLDWFKPSMPDPSNPTAYPGRLEDEFYDQNPSGTPQTITGEFYGTRF